MAVVAGVAAGGLVGAPARFLVDRWATSRTGGAFPWGTLVINVTGSLLLGVISGLVAHHVLGPAAAAVAGTGFCGAYTTFSTFSYETVRLLEEGETGAGLLNAAGSLVLGLAAAMAGIGLAALA
ncbi:MAG TPA: fluoride efflux transporter CrcB [Acidimicrobiales bacterium]|nr:fluoride efflux transporter CrcB [Acidimicrobiales bacterium]